ncbi:pickpocket 13 isoform X2 [Rhodnius prolixus]|uniref:pickpocket 13 isoform X2 n=1 Tax=Rhodnius prolixus TaxID=13249 RepID=UPI003D18C48A
MNLLLKMLRSIFNALRYYCINTSFHGLRFIAEGERHWTERLLWLTLCLISWLGSGMLISSSWDSFQTNAVSFVVETSYLNTNTTFPSISVCEEGNMQKIYDISQEIWGVDHDNNLDEILKELSYFRGEVYYLKEFCFSGDLDCPKDNFYDLINKARSNCSEIFNACFWKGKPFDCCTHFVKTETELGPCYMFSSNNERKLWKNGDPSHIITVSSMKSGLAMLSLQINVPGQIYIHSESELPYLNTLSTDILKIFQTPRDYKHAFAVTDVENPPEVRELSIHQRKCRFPEENYLEIADVYAYSSCEVDCRKKEQLRLCNCSSHLMPKTQSEKCDLDGILCLNNNVAEYIGQKTKWGDNIGLLCDCLPACNDAQYNTVTSTSKESTNNYSTIEIFLDRLPSERYKRNVVRTRLDLVVSMGGAAGLFVGASLLSFVEIFYFFILRTHKSEKYDDNDQTNVKTDSEENVLARSDQFSFTRTASNLNRNELIIRHPFIPQQTLFL